ncbi:MAG: ABC transporter substrate-binding protein [Desulfobacterales bacterium]|nr:ABC transporter substrate-binding protein [Desulfobacterales bacterium]MCP4159072.1 ABC transporter substrate-binding protein [Deltaproteobacteria bacterium]
MTKWLYILIFVIVSANSSYAISISGNIITDNAGRVIEVKSGYKRIISLYGAHTENLLFLGAVKNIIGVSKHDRLDILNRSEIKKFSYRDGVEKFIAAKPDLIIIRPMIDRSYKGLIKRLSKHTDVISLQPSSINEMFIYWKALGMLSGKKEKSSDMINNFKKAVKEFESIRPGKKNVYFESIHRKMKTFYKDAMAIYVLEKAGGVNVAKDAKQVRKTNIAFYGKERILEKADQIDVYLAQKGVMNRTSVNIIKYEPGFSLIKAVKNNRIYLIDEHIVSRPTMRLLKGIYKIGSYLYPEIYLSEGKKILKRNMR